MDRKRLKLSAAPARLPHARRYPHSTPDPRQPRVNGPHRAEGKHFETLSTRYEQMLERIEALILDARSLVELLEANIESEEGCTGEFDPASSNYPIWARRLRARRDNLVSAISELEMRLAANFQ
jgi:hypothetical protein